MMLTRVLGAALLALIVGATPALADDLSDGYELGRMAQAMRDLAADLFYIESLADQFAVGKEELVGADPNNTDFALAGGALTYAIWQTKLAVLPTCEDWLRRGALDPKPVKEYRAELADVLEAVQTAAGAFEAGVSSGDSHALSTYAKALHDGDYAKRLLDVADRAGQKGRGRSEE